MINRLKFALLLTLLAVVTGVTLVFAKDAILRSVFESALRALTGFEATVQSVGLDLGKGEFAVKGLTILNPYEYQERIFADIPEISIRANLPRLLQKKGTHLHKLVLNIRELNVEKNEAGVSNISRLTSSGKPRAKRVSTRAPSAPKTETPFYLDRLEVTLRRVRYHDRSGVIPKKLSVDMRMEGVVFEGIRDPKSIVNVIVMRVVTASPLGNLGVNPQEIENRLRASVQDVSQFGEKIFIEKGGELYARTGMAGRETLSTVGGAAREGLGSAAGELGGLFGKLRSSVTEEASKGQTGEAAS